jgi:hypothetical protein
MHYLSPNPQSLRFDGWETAYRAGTVYFRNHLFMFLLKTSAM